jgi:alanine-glyoxylate transaminase/serine-glyoxylate transaminase/serine-pyruvate transaminase
VLKGDWRRAVRPAEVEARLREDKAGKIKAILAVQVDTASGVANDIDAIGQAIKAARHSALFMVDVVASLGCVPFEMDEWGVDVAVAGSQKGLMMPPGLGFVAVSQRAREAHAPVETPIGIGPPATATCISEMRGHPAGTSCSGAAGVLDMLLEEGLDNVFHGIACWRRRSVARHPVSGNSFVWCCRAGRAF